MKDNITLSELELPQIRQMVLENTRRINKNELTINEMRMKQEEESRKRREHDEYWANIEQERERERKEREQEREKAQQKHDREMDELREMMRISFVHAEEDRQKSREEQEKRWKEHDEKAEADRKKSREEYEERHRQFEEDLKKSREDFDRRMKELDKKIDKSHKAVTNLARQLSSTTGNIIEGLLSPSSHRMFIKAGYPITRFCKRVQISNKETKNTEMEIDVMQYGETMVIAVEVKADCEKHDIRKIIKKMERFKTLCPEHADKEVLAGVAAVNFEEGAYELAKESGLIIIHVKEESVFELEPVFTLDPVPDKSVLRRF